MFINDKTHNNEKDHDEIELSTSETFQNETNVEIHNHEIDLDEIKLSRFEQLEKLNEVEKIILRPKRISKFKRIELDNRGRSIAVLNTAEKEDNEIELSRSEQWERLNELLLLITTILMFNATSLLIAILQITWKDEGTVFNKALVLQSQKTIGMSIL